MSLQSYAPKVHTLPMGNYVYRTKDSVDLIEAGKYFAIERERSEPYGNILGIFRVKKDLKLIDLTAEATKDWMETYHRNDYQVLARYLDTAKTPPVPYGAEVNSPFADNDGVAPDMEKALWRAMNKEVGSHYKCDGWFIPKNIVWPPSSDNAGEPFHSEVMLYDWRSCLSAEYYLARNDVRPWWWKWFNWFD